MDRRVVLSCADFRLKCIIYICAWNTQSLPTHTTTSHIFILPEFFSDTCEENSEMPGSYSVKSDAKSVGGGSDFSIANLTESSRPTCPESCSSGPTKPKGCQSQKAKSPRVGEPHPPLTTCQGATPTSDKARRPTPTTGDRGRRWRLIGKEGSASKVLSGTYENVAEVGTGRVALSMQRLRQGGTTK